ncbi:MAG: ATP-dependent RecD-like DNA helicase [Prochloraceae cyanobacterium]|nr:ATP-dependent RecD-like DNA helicase [Prochloraceae cyanobacterium]
MSKTLEVMGLTGVVERLTYHSTESGYTVARLKVPKFSDLVTVVGSFANIQPGQTLRIKGYWKEHPQYGQQFNALEYTETLPATITGIQKYLGSGLIKGVGPVYAKRIVEHFGLETLEIIENETTRLIEVPGIGKKRVETISKAWVEQLAIKEVMVFLTSHNVSTTYAVKIYKKYGDKSIATVTNNPYQLSEDIFGIGFLTADKIATNIGISPWSKFRYRAGILHVLKEAAENGHCFLPQPELITGALDKLTTTEHTAEANGITAVIEDLKSTEDLIVELAGDMPLCYQPTYYHTENNLSKLVLKYLNNPITVDIERVRNWISRFTASRKISLSPQQQTAVEMAAKSRIMILTGGPGVGKTFTTKTIVALWKAMGKSIAAAAPTGRAAQRLSELTGIEALTLHRLLEFDPKTMSFKRDKHDPLPQNAIVIDETSMLDLFLAHSLLKAISKEAQILMVGDVDQLPSVGPGQVLKDLIDSGVIPLVRLTQVFRQASNSAIVTVAHQINSGTFPNIEVISDNPSSNCLLHSGGTLPEHGVQLIGELVRSFIPKQGFNPTTDLMVLSPMTRGVVGTRNLNKVLQELINPPHVNKAQVTRGDLIFRVGDRIIQLKNDYQREVFNGDLGIIDTINTEEQEVIVDFERRKVKYDYADLNEINLAFSTSIHKSQGSEYPVVILPLYMSHYMMLSRNLFYTGLTRAKKLGIIIGSNKAIAIATKNYQQQERYTRLALRLIEKDTF